MIRTAAILLLLVITPATAEPLPDWCSGSGQGCIDCPRNCRPKPAARATITMTREPPCTGWIDDVTLECRHGIGGSGMGPRGVCRDQRRTWPMIDFLAGLVCLPTLLFGAAMLLKAAGLPEGGILMGVIRIRFVTEDDMLSRLIRTQAGICMPFTPSHAEALSQDGKFYIGQHMDGGMKARPVGYNDRQADDAAGRAKRAAWWCGLPCTDAQEVAFYGYVTGKIGQPYDWKSIISFAAPDVNLHDFNHLICSAIMTAALRTKGCEYFPMPLTVPFHHISPRDLLLMLSRSRSNRSLRKRQ